MWHSSFHTRAPTVRTAPSCTSHAPNTPLGNKSTHFLLLCTVNFFVKSAQSTPRDFSNLELGRLASLMIETCNRPEFAYAHMQAFKLVGMLRTRNAVLLLAASVLKPDQILSDEVWREEIPSVFSLEWRKLRQGQDEMLAHAYAALEAMAQSGLSYPAYGIGASTYRLALRLAEQASEFEATKSRPKAILARDALTEVLGSPVEETEDA